MKKRYMDLQIHHIEQNEQVTQNDVALEDADVMDGYIPTSDDKESYC